MEIESVKPQLIYSKRPRTGDARPVLFWALFLFTGLLFGLSVAYANDYQTTRHWRNLTIATTLATTVALVVLAYRMKRHDELQWEEKEYALPEPPPLLVSPSGPDKNRIEITTVRGKAVLIQPRAGAFAYWLRDVVNPDSKTAFSKNEAKRREWEEWQYISLIAQLRMIGWIHPDRLSNGAPDIDREYQHEMKAWLDTPLL